MHEDLDLHVRFTVDDGALSDLHRLAFGSSSTAMQPWAERLERHSLTWVGAFAGSALVGFVQVAWDGGSHAFVLDTVAHPDHNAEVLAASSCLRQGPKPSGLDATGYMLTTSRTCSRSTATPAASERQTPDSSI